MAPDNSSDWRPTASIAVLKQRAQLLARVRDYFARHGVLEVETPILSAAGSTDPHLHSFSARSLAPGEPATPRYLHTSPEFAMKRLLAAGSGSIYQIARVFRGGEAGRRHNAEFTLLEWYRTGFDYHQLMDDVAALITETLGAHRLGAPEKLSYRDAFRRYGGVDPHRASAEELANAARMHQVNVSGLDSADRDGWRDLLLTHLVEPNLGRGHLTFLYDYPASQAALARIRPDDPPVAERFELYLEGIELANGFQELADVDEQRARFERDAGTRAERKLAPMAVDARLLAALAHGIPACSGVALGFDRLVMLAIGTDSIADSIAFPSERA